MPWSRIPFDPLIDFEALRGMDVLEIGVGSGSHASLLARHARSFTGIDLTEYAVKSTRERFSRFELAGRIERMDAERMEFADGSFDLIWTWGVIHHSSNTRKILQEMHRVLRPGGKATTMVQRNLWNYTSAVCFPRHLQGDLLRTARESYGAALHRVRSRGTPRSPNGSTCVAFFAGGGASRLEARVSSRFWREADEPSPGSVPTPWAAC